MHTGPPGPELCPLKGLRGLQPLLQIFCTASTSILVTIHLFCNIYSYIYIYMLKAFCLRCNVMPRTNYPAFMFHSQPFTLFNQSNLKFVY
uniref:Uncharacterized protein n=1 Tax=Anguilla anguilla TaxID=7936 RepID=A0A0E9WLK6_ANGAN